MVFVLINKLFSEELIVVKLTSAIQKRNTNMGCKVLSIEVKSKYMMTIKKYYSDNYMVRLINMSKLVRLCMFVFIEWV